MHSQRQPGQERVVVVGAGIGGLAAALDLAARGVQVCVLERAAAPGGKMREVAPGGLPMDAGPTVFTMRWVFEELFERAGSRLGDNVSLAPASLLARHAWNEDQRLDLHADVAQSADAIGRFAGAREARGYLDFCRRAARIYGALEGPFLRGSRPTPWTLMARSGWRGLPALAGISPFSTLWSALGRHFHDPRLRQLFGRYATYCGSSPFDAPATLMLVAHVEQSGVWTIDGGMHRLAAALVQEAERLGASFRWNTAVEAIEVLGGRASGVRLAGGERLAAGAVVFNGDTHALAAGLLGGEAASAVPRTAVRDRSLSALTWNLAAPAHGFPLARHSVFFSPDYRREFDDLFGRGRLPDDPTVYVCAQGRAADGQRIGHAAGDGHAACGLPERLLCLVNAPPRGDGAPFTSEEIARCETSTFERLARCGLTLERRPEHTLTTTPTDFERLFPATGGALYGRASHGWMASFRRPGSRSRLPGLYLAGGSTHPGPGVPMAALSGRLAAESVLADRTPAPATRATSTSPSHPAATPGGTSMP